MHARPLVHKPNHEDRNPPKLISTMLIVQAFCHHDWERSVEFFNWCAEIDDPKTTHRCLLVASSQCNQEMINAVNAASKRIFPNTQVIKQRNVVEGKWPLPQNEMFKLAAQWIEDQAKCPWFWSESDAAPTKPGWLDAIEQEYHKALKPFLGCVYEWVSATTRMPHLNGNAVYPPFIRKYNPAMLTASTELPWDVTRPEITLRHTAHTNLIFNDPGNRETGEPLNFPTVESLTKIPSAAVYAHRCKNGSLIARLREARNPTPTPETAAKKPAPHVSIVGQVRQKLHSMINGAPTFYHSGNLGDVIYGLYAMKEFGGGDLVIGPEQRKTAICAVPINQDQFNMLSPVLEAQSYLRKTSYSPKYPSQAVLDLNHFRNFWVDRKTRESAAINTLCACHFYELGILDKFKEDQPWLTVPDPIESGKIIIHRSPRYNSSDFPWARLVKERRRDLLFVGLQMEHEKFQQDFNCSVSYWAVKDFLELARLIAGAKAFVGNQSFPLSLAIGLGQKVTVEAIVRSPDCRFKRPTYTDQILTEPDKLDFESL